MVKTPKTVLLLTWRFSGDRQMHNYRIVVEPSDTEDARYPAHFEIERRCEDALGRPSWRPTKFGRGDDIDDQTLLRCVLGHLPDMVLTGASKRTERGQLPPGWRVCSDDDTLEIDCGTFEAQP